jgi:hypothetical protein
MILLTDWFRLLSDLKGRGWSLEAVALVTGIPVSSLDRYRNAGAQPRHDVGDRLIVLWCGATGNTRERVPVSEETSRKRERV